MPHTPAYRATSRIPSGHHSSIAAAAAAATVAAAAVCDPGIPSYTLLLCISIAYVRSERDLTATAAAVQRQQQQRTSEALTYTGGTPVFCVSHVKLATPPGFEAYHNTKGGVLKKTLYGYSNGYCTVAYEDSI